jgi:glycosyltransferase 2 family protein
MLIKMKKNGIRLGIVLLLSLVFLFFFFRSVEWKEVFRYLGGANPFFFALIVLLAPLHFVTRAVRWNVLLKHEKPGVSLYSRTAANAVGFTVNHIFPGRLGEIVKPLYLARKEGLRKGFVLGTVVVERIFDIFAMCFLLGAFLLAKPLYAHVFHLEADAFANLRFWGIAGLGIATGLLLLSLSLYFFKDKTLRVASFLMKPFPDVLTRKILLLAEEFIEGLKFFHSAGNILVYFALSLVVWICIVFYYWMLFLAFHVTVPFFLLVPYVFLTMVGASIPTPGMVGGFDYFSKLAMTSLYHIDPNLAVGMTIVVHAVQVVVTCLIGYAILWREGLSLIQLKKLGETENP